MKTMLNIQENIGMSNIYPYNNETNDDEEKIHNRNKEEPVKELIKDLKQVGQITSTHGIPRIITRPFLLKILWTVFFVASIGACMFILVGNFTDYFKFGVNTLIKVVPQDNIALPAVTVCNVNPLITHKAQQYIANYYKDTYNVTFSSYIDFRNAIDSENVPNDINWLIYQSYSPDFNSTLRSSFGFSFDEQRLWCFVDFSKCELEKFRTIYHPRYGNCFVFNSGIMSNGSRINLREDNSEEYGIDMAIFTGVPDIKEPYYYEPSNKGIVLIVDEQNVLSMDQEGLFIEPGSYAHIAITKTNSTNLPLPYNNCFESDSMNTNLTNEMRRLNMSYDRANCYTLCLQKKVIDVIGCYDLRYPRIFNATPCNNKEQFHKLVELLIDDEDCQKQCPFDCSTIIYDWSITYASFPNYNSFKIINKTNYTFLSGYFPNETYSYQDMQKSASGFFLYYDPLSVTVISQTPSLSFPELVSNAGGTLGVFLGLSLLSFAELFEVAFIICIFAYKNYIKGPMIDLKSKLKKLSKRDVKEVWIRLKDETKRIGQMTTLHAIPNMIVTKYTFVKAMWIIFFLISLGFCIYMVIRVILIYQQFNLTSTIRDEPQDPIKFPSIWFCNPNFMSTPAATSYLIQYYRDNNNVTLTDYDSFFEFENITEFSPFYWPFYQTFDAKFNKTLRQSFSYSLEDMLINCQLGSTPCNLSWFDSFIHPIFGDCFQFNTGKLKGIPGLVDIIQIDKPETGLYLELFTGLPDEYYKNFLHEWKYNAINIFISDQGHLPLDKYGRPIKPGVSASISLTLTHYHNLPEPYTQCQYADSINTEIVRNMRNANLSYDRFNCITLCQQYLIGSNAGCYNMIYPNVYNLKPCENIDEYYNNSVTQSEFASCPIWCPAECDQIVYRAEVSYTDFPTRNYAYKQLQNRNEFYTRLFQTRNITYDMFKKSVTSMYIYFEDLIVTDIAESPSVLFVDLISNIGGLVGLFIGSSVLTFVEFIELAFNLASIYCQYGFKSKKVRIG